MIAALFVEESGPYYGLLGVDPWDVKRDARTYAGPSPVVAHPPCERWGRYAAGGPNPRARRREVGDDGGCFAAAIAAVRQWGGVLEHPEGSKAWSAHGLRQPHRGEGWVQADDRGYTCSVAQGHYGHAARKQTWLYVAGVPRERLPELLWIDPPPMQRLDEGPHSKEEARRERERGAAQPGSAR